MKKLIALILIAVVLGACSKDDKPDYRQARWGMSKNEVKKAETAELVKEGNDILTYRFGGVEVVEEEVSQKDDKHKDAPQVAKIDFDYDLLYVFGEGKLAMIVVHLRDSFSDQNEYVFLMDNKRKDLNKSLGSPPEQGLAKADKEAIISGKGPDGKSICEGEMDIKYIWPTKDKRTNASLELGPKKFSKTPDCSMSIFYESVEFPLDPELSAQLHDLL